jgi:hypothetical protein
MNYYDLETHMWDKHRETLPDAARRRPAAMAHTGSLFAPARTSRIERPGLGDAS